MSYFVYLRASRRKGRIFSGVTDNLAHHGPNAAHANLLVWYENHAARKDALARQKRIRSWARACKIGLIEKENTGWKDLGLR